MLSDLRSAVRQFSRKRAVPLVAALSLALGTGATAAILSCLDAFYLRPLPVPRSHELVRLFGATEQDSFGGLSYPEYRGIRSQSTALASAAVAMRRGATWLGAGEPQDVSIYLVSRDFFQVMGLRPALGRLFGPNEEKEPVVVLGHATWKNRFGADPNIVGRTLRLSRGIAKSVTVVGVLPPEFRDLGPTGDRDMWIPPATFAAIDGGGWSEFEDWHNTYFDVIARLRPGASLRQLQAELSTITRRLAQINRETNARRRMTGMTDLDWRLHQAGTTGWALLGVVILVVAISCVNVANLLLARVEARRKELATRAAMGASRGRLARQLLIESLLVGIVGTAAGLLLAHWTIALVPALIGLPPEYQSEVLLRLDLRVFWATAAVSLGAALLFGLAPAMTGSRTDLALSLRNAPGAGFRRFPLRTWLAISQLAISLVLLNATVMLGGSFWNARHGNIGLAHKNVLAVWSSGKSRNIERISLERIGAVAGVRDASIAFRAPLSHNGGGIAMPITLPGHPEFAGRSPAVLKCNSVDFRYFQILGVRVLRGRAFDNTDTEHAPRVAVISDAMARRYWPAGDPIGKYIRAAPEGHEYQIVGVVADAPINQIGEIPEPYIYTSWWQNPFGEHTLLIEAQNDAAGLAPAVRTALAEIAPEFKRAELFTMDDLVRDATIIYRAAAQLVAALALLGLILAAVGFYGVTAYGVTLRTREIGIRMAVGARQTDAARVVVKQALVAAALGIALGLPSSIAAAYGLRAMLFGISPLYAPALLAGGITMLWVAFMAALLPAVRAARVDPLVALRCE